MGCKGSSGLIEFLIALFVGLLAVFGAACCIGFLLVEPLRNPPGQTTDTVEISSIVKGCVPTTTIHRLPLGCTLNGQQDIQRQVCDQSPCNCSSVDGASSSVCCCRRLQESPIEGIQCMEGLPTPQVTSASFCGCTVCDDVDITITLTTQHRDTQEPVAAAQIYRKEGDQLQLVGLTNNFGKFVLSEPVGSLSITLHIVAPNFIPYPMKPITLRPDRMRTSHVINLIPLMNFEVGMGGSPITIRLGTMAAISAPPAAFTMMESNETYNDLITFSGTVMTSSDDNEFLGLPSDSFVGMNEETNELEQYAVLLVAYLEFHGVEGETLTSERLRLGVSVQNDDGNLPPLSMIYYDQNTGYWVNLGPLNPIEPLRKKRQSDPAPSPVFLEMDGVPISVFVALAAGQNANCWLQARTFAMDSTNTPFPSTAGQNNGPLVTVFQRSDISGNRFLLQFGTDTGNFFNTDLAPNAICLPLACSDFTIAILESRDDAPLSSPDLLPISFPDDMFNMSSSAPLEIGTVFTWDELFFPDDPSTPNPFYMDLASCQNNARETTPERGDYFSFQIQQMIDEPQPTESCFIKIQIRDCFGGNDVTITSINPDTAAIDRRTTTFVGPPPDIMDTTTTMSGMGTTMPMDTTTTESSFVCDESTATLRAACLSYVCGDFIQIFVRVNPDSGQPTGEFCQVTGRSIIVSNEIVSEITNDQLIVESSTLKTTDFNDPNLGLYFDEGTGPTSVMMAEQRCNAGTGEEISTELNVETGIAATFSCF